MIKVFDNGGFLTFVYHQGWQRQKQVLRGSLLLVLYQEEQSEYKVVLTASGDI